MRGWSAKIFFASIGATLFFIVMAVLGHIVNNDTVVPMWIMVGVCAAHTVLWYFIAIKLNGD